MKALTAIFILTILISAACSGGRANNESVSVLDLPRARPASGASPDTALSEDGGQASSDGAGESSGGETSVQTEPAEDLAPEARNGQWTNHVPEGTFGYNHLGEILLYGYFTELSHDRAYYFFDVESLPLNTGRTRTENGKTLFYVQELDDYLECDIDSYNFYRPPPEKFENLLGHVTSNGYCDMNNGDSFLNSEGMIISAGTPNPVFFAGLERERQLLETKSGTGIIYRYDRIPIPDPLPEDKFIKFFDDTSPYLDDHKMVFIPCREVGNIFIEERIKDGFSREYVPGGADDPFRENYIFWIHEDGVCRNTYREYIGEDGVYDDGPLIRPPGVPIVRTWLSEE